MQTHKRKGMMELGGLVWQIGFTGIVLGVVLLILAGFQAASYINGNTSLPTNFTNAMILGITALATIPTWFAVIVVAVVGIYLLSLVSGMRGGHEGGGV